MLARSGIGSLLLVVGLTMTPPAASAPGEPKPFVAHVVDEVVARLSADIEEDTRQKRFHVMMDRYLAVDTITAFVTGPYWNEATASERDAFRAAFRDLLGARFLPALAKAGDVDIDIVGKRTLRDGLWSVTARVRPGGTSGPTRVQLRVMQQEGSLRIADVVTRGISLGVTLREEYTSYLERHDGDFGALTERVRSRAADLRP